MRRPIYQKSILALAISTASLIAHAQTIQLTDSGFSNESGNYPETITFTGSYTGTNDAIEFSSSTINGSLILDATIVGTGADVDGLDLSSVDLESGEGPKTLIKGDLVNKGTITVSGDGASALLIDPAEITGSIINEGTLRVTGDAYLEEDEWGFEYEVASAMDIAYSDIKGDIHNKGSIIVEGEGATGILVFANTNIGGDLLNDGTIQATGTGAMGIGLEDSTIGGSLINNGTIQATGGQFGIELQYTTIGGSLTNNGTIQATGFTAAGIELEDSTIGGSLINNGTIQATGSSASGIELESSTLGGSLINNGTITVTGLDGAAVELENTTLTQFVNTGTIQVTGDDSEGLEVDDAHFTHASAHIVNTGLMSSESDAVIAIGDFSVSNPDGTLVIKNTGTLYSGNEAIDVQFDSGPVHLLWGEKDKTSAITGNLIGLSHVQIAGTANFTGTPLVGQSETADPDHTAHVRMKGDGWIDVGSSSANTPAHLELGLDHTVIDGNLYVAGNSSLGMSLSNSTDVNTAVLSVSGEAEFAQGSQIKLKAKNADFTAEGTQYILVDAGKLTNEGLAVLSSSSLLNIDTYEKQGNQIIARVTVKQAEQIVDVIDQFGGSSNAQQAGASFIELATNQLALNPNDPVRLALIAASEDPAKLKALVEQLVPEVNGGATSAAVSGQGLVSNAAGNRTAGMRGQSSGEAFKEAGVWVQTLYSTANQDVRNGIAGFDADSRGIAVGVDGKLNDQTTLGVAYSFLNTKVDSDSGNKTEVDGHSVTLYGGYEVGNYFVDGSLTYGMNDNQSKRYIASTTAKGDYDSDVLGLNLVGGYAYHISDALLIEPRVAARYSQVNIDRFREKGSSAALAVEDQRYEVAELGLGVRFAGSLAAGQGTLKPHAKLMAYHDFAADQVSSTSSFVLGGTPFVSKGSDPVRNSYEAGVGADYSLGALTLGLAYEHLGKTDFNADTVVAKVRYDF